MTEPHPKPVISAVEIERFRSIVSARVELGRLTVVIGANGSGKSNLLEAIALAGAASALKGDVEFLASRGIRVAPTEHMISRFAELSVPPGGWPITASIRVHLAGVEGVLGAVLEARGDGISRGPNFVALSGPSDPHVPDSPSIGSVLVPALRGEPHVLSSFLIYSPEYRALRTFEDEAQIRPLGVRGEGLFAHLWHLARHRPDVFAQISERMRVLDWFDGFNFPSDLGPGERRLTIRDRYLAADVSMDQRSANEGFLFLLFVYTLLLSPDTPRFFAIDNADTSLNPLLCQQLTRDIASLAREYDKQVVLTTHNAALLDGLDLAAGDQRLLVAERDLDGYTHFRRVERKEGMKVNLSEAFLRGYLGGLPRGF